MKRTSYRLTRKKYLKIGRKLFILFYNISRKSTLFLTIEQKDQNQKVNLELNYTGLKTRLSQQQKQWDKEAPKIPIIRQCKILSSKSFQGYKHMTRSFLAANPIKFSVSSRGSFCKPHALDILIGWKLSQNHLHIMFDVQIRRSKLIAGARTTRVYTKVSCPQ